MEKRFRIARKFGKGIVDESGRQVAWVDDYLLAKRVCMFLNSDKFESMYPEYVRIGGACYRLDGDDYYCDRTGDRVEFTVDGGSLYVVGSGELIRVCSRGSWEFFNDGFID